MAAIPQGAPPGTPDLSSGYDSESEEDAPPSTPMLTSEFRGLHIDDIPLVLCRALYPPEPTPEVPNPQYECTPLCAPEPYEKKPDLHATADDARDDRTDKYGKKHKYGKKRPHSDSSSEEIDERETYKHPPRSAPDRARRQTTSMVAAQFIDRCRHAIDANTSQAMHWAESIIKHQDGLVLNLIPHDMKKFNLPPTSMQYDYGYTMNDVLRGYEGVVTEIVKNYDDRNCPINAELYYTDMAWILMRFLEEVKAYIRKELHSCAALISCMRD